MRQVLVKTHLRLEVIWLRIRFGIGIGILFSLLLLLLLLPVYGTGTDTDTNTNTAAATSTGIGRVGEGEIRSQFENDESETRVGVGVGVGVDPTNTNTTITHTHDVDKDDAHTITMRPTTVSCVMKWPSLSSIEMPRDGIEPDQLEASHFPDWAPISDACSNSTLFDPDGILPSEAFNQTRVAPDRPRRVLLIPWFSWSAFSFLQLDLLRQFVYTMSTVCNKHSTYTPDPSHSAPLLFSPDDRLCDVTFILLVGTDWWTASETFETWLQRELGRYYELISDDVNGRYLKGRGSIASFLNSYADTEYSRDASLRQCPHITKWGFGGKYRAPVLFIEDGLLRGEIHNVILVQSETDLSVPTSATKKLNQLQERMLLAFEHD